MNITVFRISYTLVGDNDPPTIEHEFAVDRCSALCAQQIYERMDGLVHA